MKFLMLLGVCYGALLSDRVNEIIFPIKTDKAGHDGYREFGTVKYVNDLRPNTFDILQGPYLSSGISLKLDGRNFIEPIMKSKNLSKENTQPPCTNCEEFRAVQMTDDNLSFDEEMENITKELHELESSGNEIEEKEENIDDDLMFTIEKQLKEIKYLQLKID